MDPVADVACPAHLIQPEIVKDKVGQGAVCAVAIHRALWYERLLRVAALSAKAHAAAGPSTVCSPRTIQRTRARTHKRSAESFLSD